MINNTVTANCLYANESEILGEAKGQFSKQQAILAGRIQATDPFYYVVERF